MKFIKIIQYNTLYNVVLIIKVKLETSGNIATINYYKQQLHPAIYTDTSLKWPFIGLTTWPTPMPKPSVVLLYAVETVKGDVL